eukprot:SAG25_NODE_54_length_18691_cov_566.202076_8_plen_110_part_00
MIPSSGVAPSTMSELPSHQAVKMRSSGQSQQKLSRIAAEQRTTTPEFIECRQALQAFVQDGAVDHTRTNAKVAKLVQELTENTQKQLRENNRSVYRALHCIHGNPKYDN